MLTELSISNFAIIDTLRLAFSPGLTVLTGETGAGKSIIVDALSLALGERASEEMVRSDANMARVEAVFSLDPVPESLSRLFDEYAIECDGGTLILSRDILRGGRSTPRINSRAMPLRVLEEVGAVLVDIHGQSEHLSLKHPRTHIDYLDGFGGLLGRRADVAAVIRRLADVRRELESLLRDERELARRLDLLTFQVEEISAAQLRAGDEEALRQERQRLANAEKLAQHSDEAYRALRAGDDESASALDRLGEARHALLQLVKLDSGVAHFQQVLDEAVAAVDDLSATLRAYRETVEFNPVRLAQVDERLEAIFNLKRKYGDSIESVLAYGARAAAELETITHRSERVAELRQQEDGLLDEVARMTSALSAKRKEAARTLAAGIERELADLYMPRAKFAVDFQRQEDAQGVPLDGKRIAFNESGIDRIEFLVSANPGEPPKPLAKVASGGETSRLMLALKSVLTAADKVPTLIFDEIDVGIGGRTGAIVGRKLWRMSAGRHSHQVICITHLPQIAAYGDAHYRVDKVIAGQRTRAAVQALEGKSRIGELALMLGAAGEAGEQSAEEILQAAERDKS